MSITKKTARVVGKVVKAPFSFILNSYILRYTSFGRPYSPGQSTAMVIEDGKRSREQLANILAEMEENKRKIPKTAKGLRNKYLRAMKQYEMTFEDRKREHFTGQALQVFAITYWACMITYGITNAILTGDFIMIHINNGIVYNIMMMFSWMVGIGYFIFGWKAFSARNMMMVSPLTYLIEIVRHPIIELTPLGSFEDRVDKRYPHLNLANS
jgi:hypothetical protein